MAKRWSGTSSFAIRGLRIIGSERGIVSRGIYQERTRVSPSLFAMTARTSSAGAGPLAHRPSIGAFHSAVSIRPVRIA